MSRLMNEEYCLREGIAIAKNIYYISAQVIQIVVNCATIIFIISTRKYLLQYRVHNSVKVIFCALCGCICLHCLVFVAFQMQHLFSALTAVNPCDVFQSPIYCVLIRFIVRTTCNYFVLLQLGFCIDRTTATVFTKAYEVSRVYLGALICILAAILSLAAAALTDWSSENDEPLISCLNNNKDNWIAVDVWNYVFMATNISTFLWVCIVFLINRKMHKRWDRNLSCRFQIQENIDSSRLIIILGFIQFVFFSVYISSNIIRRAFVDRIYPVTYRTLAGLLYMVSYYCLVTPVVMVIFICKQRRTKLSTLQRKLGQASKGTAGQNAYFGAYQQQW